MTTTPTTPAESDPFFQLLTDALRAGPGSPQWGEAVARLRDGGVKGADEYRLIIRAREDIELGRDYRKVAAGPEFTRKVLGAVEREGKRPSGVPTATIVAIVAGLVILGVIITVIVIMSRGGGGNAADRVRTGIDRLDSTTFPVAIASASFEGSGPPAAPWEVTGTLPLDFSNGLRPEAMPAAASKPTTLPAKTLHAGTLLFGDPLPASGDFVLEARLDLPPNPPAHSGVSVFVSDSKQLATGMTGKPGEVAWMYSGVSANGNITSSPEPGQAGKTVRITIRFNSDAAIVEMDGRRLYAGPSGLRPNQGRYVGVSFLGSEGDEPFGGVVRSLNISRSASSESAGGR
jgi:hypothetical protein